MYRGMLVVGRLLDDPALVSQARDRLAEFMRRGFYHDGFWRQADASAHRRIVGELDSWIAALIEPSPGIATARRASASLTTRMPETDVQQASWPSRPIPRVQRGP